MDSSSASQYSNGDTMMSSYKKPYGVPENYNPADHAPVKLRHQNSTADRSETQRKRRSKNRLSNRRSTGYVSNEIIEEALRQGPNPENGSNGQEN